MADKPTANGDTNGIITPVEETSGSGAANDNNAPANGPDLPAPEVVDESPIVRDPSLVPNEENRPFSWLQPHPIFVIALVGSEETPFGIQKDFLCAKSAYYKKYFVDNPNPGSLENLVRLPDTPVEVFAYAQNFLFTGHVSPGLDNLPSYDVLIGVWKLGHHLAIEGLCDATLDAMTDCRRVTQHIPATPLLVQVWKDTPEGSSIRKLLLSWAAEYMRSSDSRADFARSLPQEVLSELVVAMSSLDTTPLVQVNAASADAALPANAFHIGSAAAAAAAAAATKAAIAAQAAPRRNVHYLDSGDTDGGQARHIKKQRHSDVLPNGSAPAIHKTTLAKKPGPRVSLPSGKPVTKRRSTGFGAGIQPSTNQKLNFCADLLTRMLSGPGFWTRLVGPFKEPVDPTSDGVPDYLEKVTRPMDLGTMKVKMDRREYNDDQEFLADMNQIFSNCYTYWSKKDPMWGACERLQKTFEEKFSQMNKWIAKLEGDEGGH